ncbi:MAG: YgiQ family radical SAM protein [Oscillospiraceae bacterium]|nr:YgiQ family radical SAM protein [Oscillospiraceae bacterium]
MAGFLPINRTEMERSGITRPDFVFVCGDAYVDHPSFGMAIISRVLESRGYSVCFICQPDWHDPASIKEYGEPRLGFLVSSGNMDSMVNHYTVAKKKRGSDAYSPGGKAGKRPDNALIVYCNLIRSIYKKTPIIVGGIEASLRRLAHYDYWADRIKRSVLLESGADILAYGMGEKAITEIADALNAGIPVGDITYVRGTVFKTRREDDLAEAIVLPSFPEITASKRKYAESFREQYLNTDPVTAKKLCEPYDGKLYIVQNPPQGPLTMQEMDDVYALPYMRTYHPVYEKDGGIPALAEVKFSLTSNRGCFGECNFCALTFHEGRMVQARSHESIIAEAEQMMKDPEFKGYIHDVGGPTAQFRAPSCEKQLKYGTCSHRRCLYPKPCPNMKIDHSDYLELLRKLRKLDGVKQVFVRSGIRYDYLLADKDDTFFKELCRYHISGQLRVAPEHVSDGVLSKMGKPSVSVYNRFVDKFYKATKAVGKDQYVVPYLISSHPGSTLKDAIKLAEYLHANNLNPEQVQDFYPTPGTISTCMYYTGLDPITMRDVYVARDPHEKAMQRALIQYRNPRNYELVRQALVKARRFDLIGTGEECLIRERSGGKKETPAKSGNRPVKSPKQSTKGKISGRRKKR